MNVKNAFFFKVCCFKRTVITEEMIPKVPKKLKPRHSIGSVLSSMATTTASVLNGLKRDAEAALLRSCTPLDDSQLLAIVGHELGHWKYNHFGKKLTLRVMALAIEVVLMSVLYHFPQTFQPFGFEEKRPPIIVCIIIMYQILFPPIKDILNFVGNIFGHSAELDADKYAAVELDKGAELKSALTKLHMSDPSKQSIVEDRLHNLWYDSHPSLEVRLNNIIEKEAILEEH